MALGSTQPLTEMNTRNISWGKGGRCVRLTTYHHPVPLSRNLGTLTSWNPLGPSGSSVGTATDYGLDGPGSNPGGDEIYRPFRPALGPTQPHV